MDKKLIIGVLVAALIIGIIMFGIGSCNPRKKVISTDAEEYSAFINANIEFTCDFIKDKTLAASQPDSEKKLNDIYAKYLLPVDDNPKMMAILQKYQDDANVISIIKGNTANCLIGGSPIFYQAK